MYSFYHDISTLSQNNLASSLAESAVSNVSSTAVESAVRGDSFSDALESQGSNILIGAAGNLGANAIGKLAHGGEVVTNPETGLTEITTASISKPTQYFLHGALGCGMGLAGGGDCASGTVSGVVGEIAAEKLYGETTFIQDPNSPSGVSLKYTRTGMSKDTAKELSGLIAGYSSIFTGNAVGLSDSEVAENIFSGQRIGKNAAENNALAFRIQPNAAGGNGHMTGYFQDESGNWYQYDQ